MNETIMVNDAKQVFGNRVRAHRRALGAHAFSVWTVLQLIFEWWNGMVVEEMDVSPGEFAIEDIEIP